MLPFVIWSIEMYTPETRTGIPLPDFRFYAYSSQEIAKPRVGYNLIGYILTKGLDIGRSVSLFRFLSLHSAQISTLVLLRCLHLIREFKVFGVEDGKSLNSLLAEQIKGTVSLSRRKQVLSPIKSSSIDPVLRFSRFPYIFELRIKWQNKGLT